MASIMDLALSTFSFLPVMVIISVRVLKQKVYLGVGLVSDLPDGAATLTNHVLVELFESVHLCLEVVDNLFMT